MNVKDIEYEIELAEFADFTMDMWTQVASASGLKTCIWVGKAGNDETAMKIRVANHPMDPWMEQSSFIVEVGRNPKILTPSFVELSEEDVGRVLTWIKINYEVLMQMWWTNQIGASYLELVSQLQTEEDYLDYVPELKKV
jgi:hypothetical protein